MPIYAPSKKDIVRPARATIASIEAARRLRPQATHSLTVLGPQRFALLRQLGLDRPGRLDKRVRTLTPQDLDDLRWGLLNLASNTIARLLHDAAGALPPATIWSAGASNPLLTIGSTFFWADHYLSSDYLLDAAVAEPLDPDSLISAVRDSLQARALIEAGLLVPVATDILEVAMDEPARAMTEADLQSPRLMRWLRDQIQLVEGPSDRQVIFLRPRDDELRREYMYIYAEIVETSTDASGTMRLLNRLFGPYRPDFDYSPWINQSRRRTAVSVLRELNLDLAFADAFGAHVIARTPFQGRLLRRKGTAMTPPQALAWSEVPTLIEGDPNVLARILSAVDAVEALRSSVREAFQGVGDAGSEHAQRAAREYVRDIRHQAEGLRKRIRTDRKWGLYGPLVLGAASLTLGAVGQVTGMLAAAATAAVPLLPYRLTNADHRRQAAYAILVGGSPAPSSPSSSSAQSILSGARLHDTALTR